MDLETYTDILDFWFGEPTSPDYGQSRPFWFGSTPELDLQIKEKFETIYDQARAGELTGWQKNAEGCLSLILILDQFSRNMFRGTPKAFGSDAQAMMIAKLAINNGFDQQLPPFQRKFLYMPFMHTENLADQIQSVVLFEHLADANSLDYAIQHRDIIARFGRFPHRNAILGRKSTDDEIAFLQQPGSSF